MIRFMTSCLCKEAWERYHCFQQPLYHKAPKEIRQAGTASVRIEKLKETSNV